MTSVPPVNPKATVPAVRNADDWPEDCPAGTWGFYTYREIERAGMLFACPCGCGEMMSVAFSGYGGNRPQWQWDGNEECPTLTPSINILQTDEAGNRVGEHWHGWLTNGVFKSC